MDRGQVLEQQVVVNVDEPVYVINIKRAIVSQLQLPILPKDEYDKPVVQVCGLSVHTHARTHARTYARTHTYTHAHAHTYTHARTQARTLTHAHTHTHTHARTHTHLSLIHI